VSVPPPEDDAADIGRSLLASLYELRSRGMKAGLGLLAVFLALVPFSQRIFTLVSKPIMAKMPVTGTLITRDIASPLFTPLKATFWVALFISMPFLLYQIWRLVDFWLPRRARRVALPFVIASMVLFYFGVAFAFFLILPLVFNFFTHSAPPGVSIRTDIKAYLDFTIGMLFAFGVAFQVPIAIVILVWTGVVKRETLKAGRPYIFLGAFVVGMFLTPPDMFSQTLLALPMYLLYEGALLFSKRFAPKAEAAAEDDEPADTDESSQRSAAAESHTPDETDRK
jgi:sec-independent protein translocase protein TatC